MPKIVAMEKEVVKGIIIRNFMAGGKEVKDVPLWVGQDVAGFCYFIPETQKIGVITDGKLVGVNISGIGTTGGSTGSGSGSTGGSGSKPGSSGTCPVKGVTTVAASPLPSEGKYSVVDKLKVDSIVIDASKAKESDVITIPMECVLEYGHGNVADDATVLPMLQLKLHLLLSDNHEQAVIVEEGDVFSALIYRSTPAPAIVIDNFTVKGFTFDSKFDVTGLVLSSNDGDVAVPLSDIKYFGTEANRVADMTTATEAIKGSKNNPKTVVALAAPGKIEEQLNVGHVVQISGVKVGIPANVGDRANDTIDENSENVVSKKIASSGLTDIVLDGMTFTDECELDFNDGLNSLELDNCKFAQIKAPQDRSYLIHTINNGASWTWLDDLRPVPIHIEGCYFGNQVKQDNGNSGHKIYNMIEIIRPWADGSYIGDCTFNGAATNNYINIYEVEDNATVTIENCHVDEATGFCRIAASGTPKNVTINIRNITYDTYDMKGYNNNDTWGLISVQPNAKIEDMSGVRINIDGCVAPDHKDQSLYCLYLNETLAAKLNDPKKYPKIYINGVKQETYHLYS